MRENVDIVVFGTGNFAARILFDLAATADVSTEILVAGRHVERLAWLVTAARARAHMFGRPVTIISAAADPADQGQAMALLARAAPKVVLQAASMQAASVIAGQSNAWSRLVADGGLSASTVFQALLSSRVARACREAAPGAHFINCCFPDVVNSVIVAMGLPVTCGIGNIQILAHAFAGALPPGADIKVLAHYQNLAAWRRAPQDRVGPTARVWLDGTEIANVHLQFRDVQLTPEPVIDISGAAGGPLAIALAHARDWEGHAPGPKGLPGGYPVRVSGNRLSLDLPAGMSQDAAIRWNAAHEESSGLIVDAEGRARYTGRLRERLADASPELASGFHVRDLETVYAATQQLRDRMLAQSV
jgi:hypothetical protein